MGSIIGRTRKDGSTAYTAQIVIKKDGAIVHRQSETFDRKQAANAWIVKREAELKSPGGLERKENPTLSAVIDRYVAESKNAVLGTKAQVLKSIKNSDLGDIKCSEITSQRLVAFAKDLTRNVEPQTCGNYFSHLSNIFTVARPAWGFPLSKQEFDDSVTVLKKLGLIRRSSERSRRPTLEELDKLMEHFGRIHDHRPSSIPMQKIILFAIFSTRRQEEITLVRWEDLESDRILVRDMKHPGDKQGNNVYCELPPEALQVIRSMPREDERIFPYSTDAISAAFTRACKILGISDLRFHDLRHEGISRLFEIGRTIPQAAAVSGHRSWTSLKRYTHIRHAADKYSEWSWLKRTSTSDHMPHYEIGILHKCVPIMLNADKAAVCRWKSTSGPLRDALPTRKTQSKPAVIFASDHVCSRPFTGFLWSSCGRRRRTLSAGNQTSTGQDNVRTRRAHYSTAADIESPKQERRTALISFRSLLHFAELGAPSSSSTSSSNARFLPAVKRL